jgi:hypothetical protein
MKNLIKLFALIALITANASNVCGQIADTTIGLFCNGNNVYTFSNSCEQVTIEIPKGSDNIVGEVYYNDIKLGNFDLSKETAEFIINFPKINDRLEIKINVGKTIDYVVNVKIHNKYAVGLNNNLLANDVNLYSYNNTLVLENKVAPKKLTVNVYNLSGQIVFTESTDGLSTHSEFNTNLTNGIYVVHVSDSINTMVKKLLIGKHKN